MAKPSVIIISPALANANNGNWQTAYRWQRFLDSRYRVALTSQWDGAPADIMIALHARRSAASIAAFAQTYPSRPLIVVLTGTDLYRDIANDDDAQRSLQLATKLVVLQNAGLEHLPASLRPKTSVIYQSAPALSPLVKASTTRHINVTMVGHLREEKDPLTFMQAATLLKSPRIRMNQIGSALEPHLEVHAQTTQLNCLRYRWLGNMSHGKTRQFIKRSHFLIVPSRMEGGANVIIEAITSGVPVIASNISGNRGMLGDDYVGYFACGDSAALAQLIDHACADASFYAALQQQCAARAPLFAPERERAALLHLLDNERN